MEKDKHISLNLLHSELRTNETLALPFAELAQSGIVEFTTPRRCTGSEMRDLEGKIHQGWENARLRVDDEEDSRKKATCRSSNSGIGFRTRYRRVGSIYE